MSEMAKFKIPGGFILERVDLTTAEIAYGKRYGWLDDFSTVQIYAAKWQAGILLSEQEEEWAFALSEEIRAGSLPDLSSGDFSSPGLVAVWIYLSLACLRLNVPIGPRLFDVIDELYSDFDYPEEMEGFVKYMPPPPGAELGRSGMIKRLDSFLRSSDDLYRRR
jgi:hypothetical protein